MDCEDGGWTNIDNPFNHPIASEVDRNNNIRLKFCIVPYGFYGGYTLHLGTDNPRSFSSTSGMLERYHDNEDSNNKNNVESQPNGFIYGGTRFDKNSFFVWVEHSGPSRNLGFKIGVIHNFGTIALNIDDENKSNSNWHRYYERQLNGNLTEIRDLPENIHWPFGFSMGKNTGYKIAIFN